jgi:hypothetical protein
MAEVNELHLKMVLPPDGRQTRIDFFKERSAKRASPEWWHSISSWFKQENHLAVPDFELYLQMLEKEGYSEKSRKSYLFMMKRFFEYFDNPEPGKITMGEIEDYNFEFFVSGRYSRSYQLQFINAIKLYYHLIEGKELHLKQLRKTGISRKSG